MLPKGRVYSVGTDISLYCNVTGEPTPEVTWYKDNSPVETSNHVEIPGENNEHGVPTVTSNALIFSH